jgi:hypothetical protein
MLKRILKSFGALWISVAALEKHTRLCKGTAVAFWVSTAALAAIITLSPFAQFVDDPRVFELDGNALKGDLGQGGDDWAAGANQSGLTNAVTTTTGTGVAGFPFLISDGLGAADPSVFASSDKDTDDLSTWAYKPGESTDKDDISNAFAAAYQVRTNGNASSTTNPQPHTWVFFGMDRFSNSGSSQAGFWFFQNNIGLSTPDSKGNGVFTGTACPSGSTNCSAGQLHRDGDILVVAQFTQGGAVQTMAIFLWSNAQGGLIANGNVTINANAQCNPGAPGLHGGVNACAAVNATNQTAYWPYTAKASSTGFTGPQNYPPGTFFEGGIDLTQLFQTLGIPQPCFNSFLAETRSSPGSALTDSAQLKDFALGNFQLCNVSVSKVCTPLAGPPASPRIVTISNSAACTAAGQSSPCGGVHYDFSASVNNDGSGSIFDPTVTDTFPANAVNMVLNGTACASSPCTKSISAPGGISGGGSVPFTGSFEVAGNGSVSNKLSATAAAFAGGAQTVTQPSGTDPNPIFAQFGGPSPSVAGCNATVHPALTLTKTCTVDLSPTNNGVVLVLHDVIEVKNTSTDTPISNITLTNNVLLNGPNSGTDVSVTGGSNQTLAPGATLHLEPTYIPTNCSAGPPTLTGGRCQFNDTVRISSVPKDEFGHDVPSSAISGSPAGANNSQGCSVCPFGACTLSGTP